MTDEREQKIELDWSRLLGFDQVDEAVRRARPAAGNGTGRGRVPPLRLASLGAKVGEKEGLKRWPR